MYRITIEEFEGIYNCSEALGLSIAGNKLSFAVGLVSVSDQSSVALVSCVEQLCQGGRIEIATAFESYSMYDRIAEIEGQCLEGGCRFEGTRSGTSHFFHTCNIPACKPKGTQRSSAYIHGIVSARILDASPGDLVDIEVGVLFVHKRADGDAVDEDGFRVQLRRQHPIS